VELVKDRVQRRCLIWAMLNTRFGNFFCVVRCIVSRTGWNETLVLSKMNPKRRNVTQFILSGNCSTCFGCYHHPSSGAQTTVSTASAICHTVIAICRYRGKVGIRHPQHTQTSSNSSTIAADSNNGVTNTRCCRYSCLRSWWWVMVLPETCISVSK